MVGVYPDEGVALRASDPVLDPSPMLDRQWHLSAIGAEAAWNAGRHGSRDVTVAVLDTGIDYTHRDLEGLVDLERSRSFVPSDDQIVREDYPDRDDATWLKHTLWYRDGNRLDYKAVNMKPLSVEAFPPKARTY